MKWMTFDLDGVVMENPFNFGVFPHVLQHLVKHHLKTEAGQGREPEALRNEIFQKMLAEHKRRFVSSEAYRAYDWDAIVAWLTQEYDYPERFDIEALVHHYCEPPYIQSHDQADLILQTLKQLGWKIGVISNGYRKYQAPVLEALKLLHLVDELVTPEETQVIKPHPGMFGKISRSIDSKWVHVGDTLIHDIFGGNQAGAQTVWVYRRLPAEMKWLTPGERASAREGLELIESVWSKENQRYPELCQHWEECRPDWIIYNLAELLEVEKGVGQ